MNRLAKTLLTLTTVLALAIPAAAQAKNGADDPAGHVRHAVHTTTKAKTHTQTRHRHRHGRKATVRRADDNTARRGLDDNSTTRGGNDDGPNHT